MSSRQETVRSRPAPHESDLLGWCFGGLCLIPDADMSSFWHQEEGEEEAHRGNRDRIDQRVADAAGGRESRRGDERHQSATPAVADVIWHRHRRVANPAGEV